MSHIDLAFLAQHVTAYLESPYKPFLMYLPFLPWAWLISTKLDKDARYFHLNVTLWNSIHLGAGAAALVAMLLVPMFWIGWPLGIVLLVTPILVYWQYRNQQVPEGQQFELSSAGISSKLSARRQAKAARDAMIQFISDGEVREVPEKDDPDYATHMLAEDLLGPAADARASSIDIGVGKSASAVAQIIDGVKFQRDAVPPENAMRVIDYLKGCAGLDVEDRRRRQTGVFAMNGPTGKVELVLETAGSSSEMQLRVHLDRAKRLSRPFDSLGLLPSQIESLATLAEPHDRHGVVLIGAPPGHGLSTSMYSFIGRHDAFTCNIKTLEREVERELDGVDHVTWDPTNPDIDYATNLQSILRRDPDIVMLAFIKDRETAATSSEPGMQGPLIYVPQRGASIDAQIREWVKQVGDVKSACRALRAVVNQRLMRTLCPNCRQSFQPTAEQLKKWNLPASKVETLYQPSGRVQVKNKIESCPVCGGRGYLGQVGIFQVFIVDDEARKHLSSGDLKAALTHARRNKMVNLQEAALSKVASGETTMEEVVRVAAPARAENKPKTNPPAERQAG